MLSRALNGNGRGRACCFFVVGVLALAPLPARAAPVVAAKKSKVYHTCPDDCGAAKNISPQNRMEFESADAAELQGRRQCRSCLRIERRDRRDAEKPTPDDSAPTDSTDGSDGSGEMTPTANGGGFRAGARTARVNRNSGRHVSIRKLLPGGTFVLDSGERAALAGVVFPMPGQPVDQDAIRTARKLSRGRRFEMLTLAAPDLPTVRDRFGRIIVVLHGADDAEFDLAAELLEEGLVWLDPTVATENSSSYARKQSDAAWSGRGIWKRFDGAAGRTPVLVGKDAFEYHPLDCPHAILLADATQVTLNEAKGRRLAPCEYVRDDNGKP